jgi:transglutaminase/protease-like cytokinesis protein 3
MNRTSKIGIGVGSVLLAGSLAAGASAFAASSSDPSTSVPSIPDTTSTGGGHHLTPAERCSSQDAIAKKVAEAKQRISDREAKLNERLATAQANGRTEAVARIQSRLDQLQQRSERIDTRYAKYQAWVASHCNGTTVVASGN